MNFSEALKMQTKPSLKTQLISLFAKIYPMAKRWLHKFPGGVYPQGYKDLSARQPLRETFIPKELILPLRQTRGAPAIPLVKVGDQVKKFQLIAEADKGLSMPIHAPTSGAIKAIEERQIPHASGLAEMALIIETDGLDEALDNPLGKENLPQSIAEFKDLIAQAGIIGLGGAGFPAFAKLPNEAGKLNYLIINGAECEPFITCDDVLMQTHPTEITQAIDFVAELFQIPNSIIAIENNKPLAIKAMQQAAKKSNLEVKAVPTVYPMGGQIQILEQLLDCELPSGKHAADLGVALFNVGTCYAIYRALYKGEPLVSRFTTVSGTGFNKPFNIEALIGTPFNELAQLAQPKEPFNYPLIMGGPMMGFQVASKSVPVVKTTNCILANPPEPIEEPIACIRCGECAEACPMQLLPQQLFWHSQAGEYDKAEQLNLFDCIECGACSFVCPSHIPLVQYYRHAKAEVREAKAHEALTEQAKVRFEARNARLEKEKRERQERLAARKAEAQKEAKKARKAAAKSEEQTASPTQEAPLSARERAIAAAKARQKAMAQDKPAETSAQTPEDKRKAAMAAAKARAAAKKDQKIENNTQKSATPLPVEKTETTPEDRRKAAMAAAKARVAAKKDQKTENNTQTSDTPLPAEETKETKTPEDRRKAAMAAAKARAAAAKKLKEQEETNNG